MIAKRRKNYYFQPRILSIPRDLAPGKICYDAPHFRYEHEKRAGMILSRFGYTVTFLKPRELSKTKTPDILWRGKKWELKSIFKNSQGTVEGDLKNAFSQSENVMLDVTRTQRDVTQVAKDTFNYLKRRGHSWRDKVIIIFDEERYCVIDKSVLQ